MKIYIDSIIPSSAIKEYETYFSSESAILSIQEFESILLDHKNDKDIVDEYTIDLIDIRCTSDGLKLLRWLEQSGRKQYPIRIRGPLSGRVFTEMLEIIKTNEFEVEFEEDYDF